MRKILIAIMLLMIIIYLSPLLVLGQDFPVNDWDGLDSNVVMLKTLASSGKILMNFNSEIPNFMNGLSRNSFPSEMNVSTWLYYFFKPVQAYAVNEILMRVIAFWGMYLLVRKYFNKSGFEFIDAGTALAFALQPFWHFGGLSVAGIPLALYAFLNIRSHKYTYYDWLILFAIPFYSSLILSMSFFLLCIAFLWLYDAVRKKQFNLPFLGAIFFMSIIFCLVEYRLFVSFFSSISFVSHRSEFMQEAFAGTDFITSIRNTFKQFFNGYQHAQGLHTPLVVLSIFAALVVSRNKKDDFRFLFFWLAVIFIFEASSAFWRWIGLVPLKEQIDFLRVFNLSRFAMLNPVIWYTLFAYSLSVVLVKFSRSKYLISAVLIAQIAFSFYSNYAFAHLTYNKEPYTTFRSFYSEKLFTKIKKHINTDITKFRVMSIGLEPAISQYNGFYTLDGYVNNYPLKYKHEFRKIIEKELQKNETLRKYFDYWGSRCYAFVDELNRNTHVRKNSNIKLTNIELNVEQFKSMGGKYIFSAVEIINPEQKGLRLFGVFDDNESAYRIYVYEAI